MESALESCNQAAMDKDYQSLITNAQHALTIDQESSKALDYLIIAHFALQNWDSLKSVLSSALCVSTISEKRRARLNHISRGASIVHRLSVSENQTSTQKLENNWYANHLKKLDESNSLVIVQKGSIDCVLIGMADGDECNSMYDNDCNRFAEDCRCIKEGDLSGYPLDQASNRKIYMKHRIVQLEDESDYFEDYSLIPKFLFPCFSLAVPSRREIVGGDQLQVQVLRDALSPEVQHLILKEFDNLSIERPDSPAPNYVNIIDPNVCVDNGFWVPIDVRVEETTPTEDFGRKSNEGLFPSSVLSSIHGMSGNPRHAKCKIESAIPDLDPHRYALVHASIERILDTALPLLASLRSPALLLPGPLQVVVKVQRIVLEANQDYAGVWHEDGLNENVVAVVLYYYRISESIRGGDLEFASKGWHQSEDYEKTIEDFSRCVVELKEGTMVVFSNYSLVHRVLRMIAEESQGSRDFVALFVIDQRHPLKRPETLAPRKERLANRHELLVQQLKPRSHFGIETTYCGNASVSDLKWIRSTYQYPLSAFENHVPGEELVSLLNMPPPEIKRGVSFLTSLDLPRICYNPESSVEAHYVRSYSGEDVIFLVDYITKKYAHSSEAECFIEKGLRTVRLVESEAEWNNLVTEFELQKMETEHQKST